MSSVAITSDSAMQNLVDGALVNVDRPKIEPSKLVGPNEIELSDKIVSIQEDSSSFFTTFAGWVDVYWQVCDFL